jgi:hypothetical protein
MGALLEFANSISNARRQYIEFCLPTNGVFSKSSRFRVTVQYTWFFGRSSILCVFPCSSVLLSFLCPLAPFRFFVGSEATNSHLCRPLYAFSNKCSEQTSSDVFSCSLDWDVGPLSFQYSVPLLYLPSPPWFHNSTGSSGIPSPSSKACHADEQDD